MLEFELQTHNAPVLSLYKNNPPNSKMTYSAFIKFVNEIKINRTSKDNICWSHQSYKFSINTKIKYVKFYLQYIFFFTRCIFEDKHRGNMIINKNNYFTMLSSYWLFKNSLQSDMWAPLCNIYKVGDHLSSSCQNEGGFFCGQRRPKLIVAGCYKTLLTIRRCFDFLWP